MGEKSWSATDRLPLFQSSSNRRRTIALFCSDMIVLLFEKFEIHPRMRRVGLDWRGLKPLGVQSCTSDRKLGPARVERKEPRRYSPLRTRCRAWLLKKLRSDYGAGISPQTAKPRHERV